MGHSVAISCEKCGQAQELEVKYCSFDGSSVSFDFTCSCGYEKSYRGLSPAEFSELTPSDNEIQRLAKWLEIPAEQIRAYVYPPDIAKEIDLERRKCGGLELKKHLKGSRISYPQKTDDGWWHVYSLRGANVVIHYHRETKAYRIQSDQGLVKCKDVLELCANIRPLI